MKTSTYAAAVTAALLAVGAWQGLTASTCREVRVVCATSVVDAKTVTVPHEEVVTICGDKAPAVTEEVKAAAGLCKVTEVGKPYSAPLWKDAVTTYEDDATAPKTLDLCACSTGADCEWSPDGGKTWLKLARGLAVGAGAWKGSGCVAIQCGISEDMVTGVGAQQRRDYNVALACGGPGKVAVSAAAAVEVSP